MPDQENQIIIVGDHWPGLILAAALASVRQNTIIIKKNKSKDEFLKSFLQEHISRENLQNYVTIATIANAEKLIENRIVVDNYSWQTDQWWQDFQKNETALGWVSMVPLQIEAWKSRNNSCGLIFYSNFKNFPFAEIIADASDKLINEVEKLLEKIGCFTIIARNEDKFLSLAVGLHFHYLALWQAQSNKINIADTEHLLGRVAGFLPEGILSGFNNHPYLNHLHKYPFQLQEVLSRFPYVANLKDDQLLRNLPKPQTKQKWPWLQSFKNDPDLDERIKRLLFSKAPYSSFYQHFYLQTFQWVSYMVKDFPIGADQVDAIYKYAWNWPRGPFEIWSKWDPGQVLQEMEHLELSPAGWVFRLNQSARHFYRWEASGKKVLDSRQWHYLPSLLPEHLSDFKPDRILWHKPEATITDVGENLLNLEFHSKLNMMDQDAMEGIDEALNIASKEDYQGIVISNNGTHFTVGVNLGLVFISAIEKDYDYIQFMIEAFQQRMMQLKYSPVPVVMACQGYTIGGGTEMLLHLQQKVVAHQYAQIGLVETNAGLIPGGGGSKEMSIRASECQENENWEKFVALFENIASGRINTVADQAKIHGILAEEALVIQNRDWLLYEAKKRILKISDGYKVPKKSKIKVAGKVGIEKLEKYIQENKKARKWSRKKVKLLQKAAYVFCGGSVERNSQLEEQQLLDLEKEYFLKLCGERYTLQRINKILQGKK